MPKPGDIASSYWSATSPITAAWVSKLCRRDGRSCRDRSITAVCWWRNWSKVRSPMSPEISGPTGARRGRVASQLLRNADKEAAARAELRREHADARAIPDLVDLVEQVHDIEPHRRRLGPSREKIFVR